ncbi:unnamed protein product [Lactuca saligna]|uniref:Uncharacterized protein n=1 Tax=Lactuca saligna TaxID=75948 RepID=A0AA35YBP0_LACSI|nr:unnamed protein product [Lactuca saligna]
MMFRHHVLVPTCHVDGFWQVTCCDCVVGSLWGTVAVVVTECAIAMGFGRQKLTMNSAAESIGCVVGDCASGCPSSIDGPFLLMDCIGRTGVVESLSCRCDPLFVISGAWYC